MHAHVQVCAANIFGVIVAADLANDSDVSVEVSCGREHPPGSEVEVRVMQVSVADRDIALLRLGVRRRRGGEQREKKRR